MAVHVLITFTTKPDQRAAFAAVLAQVRIDLPRAPGCLGVRVFNRSDEPCVFTLLETWESQEQHRANLDRVVSSGAWEQIRGYLAEDPQSGYYVEMAG